MNKYKFNPFQLNFDEIGKTVDEFINNVQLDDFFGADCVRSAPAINAFEYEDHIAISVAAPGLKKEDFNIDIDQNVLTIAVDNEKSTLPEGTKVRRKEFDYTTFKRVFRLSNKYNFESVKASYENGILGIKIDIKHKETNRKIKVEIN